MKWATLGTTACFVCDGDEYSDYVCNRVPLGIATNTVNCADHANDNRLPCLASPTANNSSNRRAFLNNPCLIR